MNEALAWVGHLAEWFGQFFPRWVIVKITHRYVKFVRGYRVVELKPGLHFWWPVTTVIDSFPVVRQTDNLPSQTLMTTDGKVVTISGLVIYEVADIVKAFTMCFGLVLTIRDISLAAIHGICADMTLDELHTAHRKGTLDTRLRNETRKQLEEFGVRVLKVQLTDLATARVYRLVNSTTKDE